VSVSRCRLSQLFGDALALQGGQLLRVVETLRQKGRRVEYDGSRNDRPRQRPAPNLVESRDAPEPRCARLVLEQRVDERLPPLPSHNRNDECGSVNDELRTACLLFIIHTAASIIIPYLLLFEADAPCAWPLLPVVDWRVSRSRMRAALPRRLRR